MRSRRTGSMRRDAVGLTRMSGSPEARVAWDMTRCYATRCPRRHVPGIPARLAPANDPQVTREPGKLENRLARTVFPSARPDDLVVRRLPLNPAPTGFATSFR